MRENEAIWGDMRSMICTFRLKQVEFVYCQWKLTTNGILPIFFSAACYMEHPHMTSFYLFRPHHQTALLYLVRPQPHMTPFYLTHPQPCVALTCLNLSGPEPVIAKFKSGILRTLQALSAVPNDGMWIIFSSLPMLTFPQTLKWSGWSNIIIIIHNA